jgi:hypothetical protein
MAFINLTGDSDVDYDNLKYDSALIGWNFQATHATLFTGPSVPIATGYTEITDGGGITPVGVAGFAGLGVNDINLIDSSIRKAPTASALTIVEASIFGVTSTGYTAGQLFTVKLQKSSDFATWVTIGTATNDWDSASAEYFNMAVTMSSTSIPAANFFRAIIISPGALGLAHPPHLMGQVWLKAAHVA